MPVVVVGWARLMGIQIQWRAYGVLAVLRRRVPWRQCTRTAYADARIGAAPPVLDISLYFSVLSPPPLDARRLGAPKYSSRAPSVARYLAAVSLR